MGAHKQAVIVSRGMENHLPLSALLRDANKTQDLQASDELLVVTEGEDR